MRVLQRMTLRAVAVVGATLQAAVAAVESLQI